MKKLIIVKTTSNCNLNCYHCISKKNNKEMTIDVIKKLSNKMDDDKYIISFIGGEPLLRGIDFYREAINILGDNNYAFFTNFSLFNDEWYNFCKSKNVNVIASIDIANNSKKNLATIKPKIFKYADIIARVNATVTHKNCNQLTTFLSSLNGLNLKRVYLHFDIFMKENAIENVARNIKESFSIKTDFDFITKSDFEKIKIMFYEDRYLKLAFRELQTGFDYDIRVDEEGNICRSYTKIDEKFSCLDCLQKLSDTFKKKQFLEDYDNFQRSIKFDTGNSVLNKLNKITNGGGFFYDKQVKGFKDSEPDLIMLKLYKNILEL